jgi:hypothetical protein
MATFTALNLTAFSHFIPSIDYIFIYIFFLRLPRFVPPPPLFLYATTGTAMGNTAKKHCRDTCSGSTTLSVPIRRNFCTNLIRRFTS